MNVERSRIALDGAAVVFAVVPILKLDATAASSSLPEVTVYKRPTCGCCTEWVSHVRQHGFRVRIRDVTDLQPIKTRHGVPADLHSCHTTLVGGYVVEGHVPAALVERLLRERPTVVGVAVPGMPVGSPGMEVPGRPAESLPGTHVRPTGQGGRVRGAVKAVGDFEDSPGTIASR